MVGCYGGLSLSFCLSKWNFDGFLQNKTWNSTVGIVSHLHLAAVLRWTRHHSDSFQHAASLPRVYHAHREVWHIVWGQFPQPPGPLEPFLLDSDKENKGNKSDESIIWNIHNSFRHMISTRHCIHVRNLLNLTYNVHTIYIYIYAG